MVYTDKEILNCIKTEQGYNDAIKELYKQCYPMIRKLCFNYNIDDEECKDIVQDAVIVFWQNCLNTCLNPDLKPDRKSLLPGFFSA